MRRFFAALALAFAFAAPGSRAHALDGAAGVLAATLAQAGTTAADVTRAKRCAPPWGCRREPPPARKLFVDPRVFVASYYAHAHHGRRTASGERFDMHALTAAHKTLPFGTRLRVTRTGRSVVVRINDRGPFIRGRNLDLSLAAARAIGLAAVGVGAVTIERVN